MNIKIKNLKNGKIVIEQRFNDRYPDNSYGKTKWLYIDEPTPFASVGEDGCFYTSEKDTSSTPYICGLNKNPDGISGNMNKEIRKFHGWRGSTCGSSTYAHGWREVLVSEKMKRGNGWRTVLSEDLSINED